MEAGGAAPSPAPRPRVRLQLALLPAGPPSVKAVKKSEHATEGETVVLACKSDSFPPVVDWLWSKMTDSGDQAIANSSQNKFFVVSSETRTELHIPDLDLSSDPGKYVCNGTNSEGAGQAVITLRVRNRFAALWPFLGIVAEVLVLVTIIFIYEKRRKPDEVLDGEPAPHTLCSPPGGGTPGAGAAVRECGAEGQPPWPPCPRASPGHPPPSLAGGVCRPLRPHLPLSPPHWAASRRPPR